VETAAEVEKAAVSAFVEEVRGVFKAARETGRSQQLQQPAQQLKKRARISSSGSRTPS
jgi:hypothetical protein